MNKNTVREKVEKESARQERGRRRERGNGGGGGVMVTTTTILESLPNLVWLVVATLRQGAGDPERSS